MAELHEVDGWSRGGRAEGGGDGGTKDSAAAAA